MCKFDLNRLEYKGWDKTYLNTIFSFSLNKFLRIFLGTYIQVTWFKISFMRKFDLKQYVYIKYKKTEATHLFSQKDFAKLFLVDLLLHNVLSFSFQGN